MLELVDGPRDVVAGERRRDADFRGEHDFARALLQREQRKHLRDGTVRAHERTNRLFDFLVGALAEQEGFDLPREKDGDGDEDDADAHAPGGVPATVAREVR